MVLRCGATHLRFVLSGSVDIENSKIVFWTQQVTITAMLAESTHALMRVAALRNLKSSQRVPSALT